jgi:hypothetical protein
MPATKPVKKSASPAAPSAPPVPATTFASVMEKAPGKDRANLQRHLDSLSADHAKTWKAVVALLGGLAPHALQAVGKESIRFFVEDGRYKFQLYALEDISDGQLRVYLPNVIDEAVKKKVLAPSGVPGEFTAKGATRGGPTLRVEALDANNTVDAPPHYKYMLGLGRKALRVMLPAVGGAAHVELLGELCALAAKSHAVAQAANAPK